MGGDHHHHAPPYKVPHYSIYKVDDAPKLIKLREKLAQKGLTDPWIRNEVWRFTKKWPTDGQNMRALFFKGFGTGAVLCAISLGVRYLLSSKGDHGHGHGDGHH